VKKWKLKKEDFKQREVIQKEFLVGFKDFLGFFQDAVKEEFLGS